MLSRNKMKTNPNIENRTKSKVINSSGTNLKDITHKNVLRITFHRNLEANLRVRSTKHWQRVTSRFRGSCRK